MSCQRYEFALKSGPRCVDSDTSCKTIQDNKPLLRVVAEDYSIPSTSASEPEATSPSPPASSESESRETVVAETLAASLVWDFDGERVLDFDGEVDKRSGD